MTDLELELGFLIPNYIELLPRISCTLGFQCWKYSTSNDRYSSDNEEALQRWLTRGIWFLACLPCSNLRRSPSPSPSPPGYTACLSSETDAKCQPKLGSFFFPLLASLECGIHGQRVSIGHIKRPLRPQVYPFYFCNKNIEADRALSGLNSSPV